MVQVFQLGEGTLPASALQPPSSRRGFPGSWRCLTHSWGSDFSPGSCVPVSSEQVSSLHLQSSLLKRVLYRTQWFWPRYNTVGEVTQLGSYYFYCFGVFFSLLLLPTSCTLAPSLLNLRTGCKELHTLRRSTFLHNPPTQLQRWTCYGAFQIIRNPHIYGLTSIFALCYQKLPSYRSAQAELCI